MLVAQQRTSERLERMLQCREVYEKVSPGFSGRCTAPLLVDRQQGKAVCNESGIMLDNLYAIAGQLPDCAPYDLKPQRMAAEIDELNDFVYKNVNNAVYRYSSSAFLSAAKPVLHGCTDA